MSEPKLRPTKDYEKKEAQLVETFRKNIRRIAFRLAHHEAGNTKVDLKHAEASFECLNRFGLNQQPWYHSPAFEIALGGVCVGTMLASPDLIPYLFLQSASEETVRFVTQLVICVSAVLALFAYVHGWLRQVRPK